MNPQDYEQLTLFPVDSLDHASRSVLPGSEEARKMTVTSGQRCLELYKKSGPLGSLVRMCLESSIWRSTKCYLTWKPSATKHKRLLFQLVPSMPHIEDTDVQLWPTPTSRDYKDGTAESCKNVPANGLLGRTVHLYPTPTKFDATCGDLNGKEYNGHTKHAMKLIQAAKLFPTPRVGGSQSKSEAGMKHGDLAAVVGGTLNPDFVSWMMGFPQGWLDV